VSLKAALRADAPAFVFTFHRAANSLDGFDLAERSWERFRDLVPVLGLGREPHWAVEGDINWRASNGSAEWFLWHPAALAGEEGTPEGVASRDRSGWALDLDRMLERACRSSAFMALELKSGTGSRETAFLRLAESIRAHGLQDRVWLDSYSLDDLLTVRRLAPDLPLSLHTPLLWGWGILLIPAKVSWKAVVSSVRWRDLRQVAPTEIVTTFASPGRSATRRKATTLRSDGRRFIAGGLFTPGLFQKAWLAGAAGGYVRFDLARLDRGWWRENVDEAGGRAGGS
jgi:hypothetical protein